MKIKRKKIWLGGLSALALVTATTATINLANFDASAAAVEFATDSTKWAQTTGITVDSTYGLIPSVLVSNKSVMKATTVNLEANSSGTITSDFSGGNYGVMAYYFKWNEGTDSVSWDWSTGATSIGTNEFYSNNGNSEKITATGVKGDWIAVVLSYDKAPMVLECNNGTITQIGSLWVDGFKNLDYENLFAQETQISYSVADTATGVTYQMGFYSPDYGLKTVVGMNTTGGVGNSTNTRLQGAGAIRIEKIVAGIEFTTGNADYLNGTQGATPASFIKVAVDGEVSTGGNEPEAPSTSVEFGSDSTKWQTVTSIGTGTNGLVPTQTNGSSHFKAMTVNVGGNSSATFTSNFATTGVWGAVIYTFKWNEGLDTATWAYSDSPTDYDYAYNGVYATGIAGDWIAIVIRVGVDNPMIIECANGKITEKGRIWKSDESGTSGSADTASFWKQKTVVEFSSTDTSSGVSYSISYNATQSNGTEIGVTKTTMSYTSTNTNLRGEGALGMQKVVGDAAFDGTSANVISVKVDDVASEYVAGEDVEAEKHWASEASYPTDFTDGSFTLVGIGDPQNFAKRADASGSYYMELFKWIADNKNTYNMKYAINIGDIVDQCPDEGEWQIAAAAHKQLQDVDLKYSLTMGNHDYDGYWNLFNDQNMDRTATSFEKYFPYATYESWLGTENFGVFDAGKMQNSWHKFTNGDDKYLIVSLEYGVTAEMVAKAKVLIDANPDYHVIITNHAYLNGDLSYNYNGYTDLGHDGAITPDALWESLISKCPNIFMVLCGHTVSYGVSTSVVYGDAGNPIIQMKIDPQGTFDDKETLIALYNIKGTSVQTYYYSVSSDRYYAGSNFSVAPLQGSAGADGGVVNVELGYNGDMLGFVSKDEVMPKVEAISSTNTDVVTVDENGKVTAVGVGTATITYTLNGRNSTYATSGVLTRYTATVVVTCSHKDDTGNDHICDTCNAEISQCEDTDNDHLCDTCDKELSKCADDNNDHNCDICGDKLTDCEDTDNNHLCDTCDKELSKCADSNNDHNCDTCGDKLTDCEDTDNNHLCDTCDKELSKCADDNNDHHCDVCGDKLTDCEDTDNDHNCDTCGDKLTDCEDSDNDHLCDICDKELSKCADDNNDHNCDICGDKLTDCEDTDNDHFCDTCDKELSKCVDDNNDHNCDTCGDKLTDCEDTDNDHLCDTCDKELSKCADSNNDHNCDICGDKLTDCEDTDNDHLCDTCDKELSKCADENSDHNCDTCGEKVSDCEDENQDNACDICGATINEEPDEPDTPDTPDVPDEPDTPDTPDVPDEPDTPDAPDVPDEPDTPDTPDTPTYSVEEVREMINALPTAITGNTPSEKKTAYTRTRTAYLKAKDAYYALSAENQALIEGGESKLDGLKVVLDTFKAAYDKADAVDTMIISIPATTITAENYEARKAQIEKAKKAYDELTDEEKGYCEKYSYLEDRLAQLNEYDSGENKSGCSGSIGGGLGTIALALGACVMAKRKRKED